MKYVESTLLANKDNSYTVAIPAGILPGNSEFLLRTSVGFENDINFDIYWDKGLFMLNTGEDAENPCGVYDKKHLQSSENRDKRVVDIPQCKVSSNINGELSFNLIVKYTQAGFPVNKFFGKKLVLRLLLQEYRPTRV